jgi:hypothetical protein
MGRLPKKLGKPRTKQRPATPVELSVIRDVTNLVMGSKDPLVSGTRAWLKIRAALQKSCVFHDRAPTAWGNMVVAFFRDERELPDIWCAEAFDILAMFKIGGDSVLPAPVPALPKKPKPKVDLDSLWPAGLSHDMLNDMVRESH